MEKFNDKTTDEAAYVGFTKDLKGYDKDEYQYYVVCRADKKIYKGCETKDGAKQMAMELSQGNPDCQFGVYSNDYLISKRLEPTVPTNWAEQIDETTTAAASSGSFVAPLGMVRRKGVTTESYKTDLNTLISNYIKEGVNSSEILDVTSSAITEMKKIEDTAKKTGKSVNEVRDILKTNGLIQ